jgi:hypothetical protein
MRDESSQFEELVVIRGRVLLDLAGSHSLGLLAATNNRKREQAPERHTNLP